MTNSNISDLLNNFNIYWHEALDGEHKNSKNLKNLAIELKKLELNEDTLSLTERTIYARALILASI